MCVSLSYPRYVPSLFPSHRTCHLFVFHTVRVSSSSFTQDVSLFGPSHTTCPLFVLHTGCVVFVSFVYNVSLLCRKEGVPILSFTQYVCPYCLLHSTYLLVFQKRCVLSPSHRTCSLCVLHTGSVVSLYFKESLCFSYRTCFCCVLHTRRVTSLSITQYVSPPSFSHDVSSLLPSPRTFSFLSFTQDTFLLCSSHRMCSFLFLDTGHVTSLFFPHYVSFTCLSPTTYLFFGLHTVRVPSLSFTQ